MTVSKEYTRTCELCKYTCCDSSNWSKHKRTIKHLYEELKIENINLRVENEKLKQGGNTIVNIDNSTNIVINVSKDAINLDDLSDPDYTQNLAEQITKQIFNLDEDKRLKAEDFNYVFQKKNLSKVVTAGPNKRIKFFEY